MEMGQAAVPRQLSGATPIEPEETEVNIPRKGASDPQIGGVVAFRDPSILGTRMPAAATLRTLRCALLLGGILCVWLLLLAFGLGGETATTVVSDFGLAFAALAAAGACLFVGFRETGKERQVLGVLRLPAPRCGGRARPWPRCGFVLRQGD